MVAMTAKGATRVTMKVKVMEVTELITVEVEVTLKVVTVKVEVEVTADTSRELFVA
jgi:hypothetical protein